MKKIIILFAIAFLLINCDNTKDDKSDKTEKDATEKKDETKNDAKKPDTTKPVVLHDHFDDIKQEDLTKEDNSGWPQARKDEILKMCLEDVGDDGKKAKAYCYCQLDNAMKIFASYKEAMSVFNKTEDDRTEEEIKKLMQMEETDANCMEQNYRDFDMDDDGDEKDGE